MFRSATQDDTAALIDLAASTGVFLPQEAEALLGGVLDDFHAGRAGKATGSKCGPIAIPGCRPRGCTSPRPPTPTVCGTSGGSGLRRVTKGGASAASCFGSSRLRSCASDGRLLVIETSSQPKFDRTRRFYARHGYAECGRVPDFYADEDGKVIYAKRLARRANEDVVQ